MIEFLSLKDIKVISARLAVLLYWTLTITSKRKNILIEENISKNADAGNQKGQVFYALVITVDVLKCRSVLLLLGGYLVCAVIISLQRTFDALH